MAFDKKSAPSSGNSGARQGMNPMVAGIIIGLLLGIFLALGVAVWLNSARDGNFIEKTKPSTQLQPMKVPTSPPGSTASSAAAKTAATDPNKQRFDFYQILPGDKNANDANTANAVKQPNVQTIVTPAPPKEPSRDPIKDIANQQATAQPGPIKSLNEILYLQAGAFQNASEADNMKAKIAFAGFEANVQSVNLAAKGTLYRVRLGPYKSQDEVNRIKNVLSQNGISAAVVKPE